MRINQKLLLGLLILFSSFSFSMPVLAESKKVINDAVALKGLKEAKGVFLIDFTNPKKTAFYLDIIRGTHQGFVKQGLTPDLILVFIGKTVQYLSTKPEETLAFEHEKELNSIKQSVKALHELGVRMEVCAIATKVFGIDNDTILPGMDVVGDGFISLIAWQTKGYKLVPIF